VIVIQNAKEAKNEEKKRGPREERLIITQDPQEALTTLLKTK
jgi:hypothetical protein